MKVIKAGYEIIRPDMESSFAKDAIYQLIEGAGRTCYKSEAAITQESAEKFITKLTLNHHEAMLEHASMTVRFTVDRGVSHELVRHRLASFAQESTRYCNYSQDKFGKEITVIQPCFFDPDMRYIMTSEDNPFLKCTRFAPEKVEKYVIWYNSCKVAEDRYFMLLEKGATPQEARSVLPNSLKTEVVMTANMREWRHFFNLRAAGTTGAPHPQMLEVARPLLEEVAGYMPELFGDILKIAKDGDGK